ERENPQDGGVGNDEQDLAALGFGSLVRSDQGVKPGRIAKLSPGHVHHERAVSVRGCIEQSCPQRPGVRDVDLLGRGHHRHALDDLNRETAVRHLSTSCGGWHYPDPGTTRIRPRAYVRQYKTREKFHVFCLALIRSRVICSGSISDPNQSGGACT